MEIRNQLTQTENLFRDVFFTSLAMVIPPINIICLVYWGIKKNKRFLVIGFAILTTIFITITAAILAFCTVYKTTPSYLFKNGRFHIQEEPVLNESGYLEVGGRMLQISSEESLTLFCDSEKVVLYTPDDETRLVLYEDSGIEVGSLSEEDLNKEMLIEDPADYFDNYEEKYYTVAERLGLNEKDSYMTYTQGLFEHVDDETEKESSGFYTEVYVLQDIGAKTYLRIRIADYTGDAPSSLVIKYALTLSDIIA